ncbi:TetR/AcrR family transcriptional regulator [Arcticibacter sp. MXS-1]|uniref:TetR/AcrR family transcriptional regulator n=1 Tax=Arcticibacter sp. MXS-1 TaxID=3341726 RepID=UPI0035A8B9ED
MGSKERIQRLKEENRINILESSLRIVKEEGWQALSMRKIADEIEYTAPMIYEYFPSKEAILAELARQGHLLLARDMRTAKEAETNPEKQLEGMWLRYWNFAFTHKELYQLMFGVGITCCQNKSEEGVVVFDLVCDSIRSVMNSEKPSEEIVSRKFYTYWSVIHGLVSINLVNGGVCERDNRQILKDAITAITRSLKD